MFQRGGWWFWPFVRMPVFRKSSHLKQIFRSRLSHFPSSFSDLETDYMSASFLQQFINTSPSHPASSRILYIHDLYILSVYTYILHTFTVLVKTYIVVHISSEDFVGTPQLPASNVATKSHVLALTPVTPARQTDCRACCAACDWWVADFPPVTPALLSDCRACRCCDWWVAGFKNRCWMVCNERHSTRYPKLKRVLWIPSCIAWKVVDVFVFCLLKGGDLVQSKFWVWESSTKCEKTLQVYCWFNLWGTLRGLCSLKCSLCVLFTVFNVHGWFWKNHPSSLVTTELGWWAYMEYGNNYNIFVGILAHRNW